MARLIVGTLEKAIEVSCDRFYDNKDEGRHLVRFTFCNQFDVLDEGVGRLKALVV